VNLATIGASQVTVTEPTSSLADRSLPISIEVPNLEKASAKGSTDSQQNSNIKPLATSLHPTTTTVHDSKNDAESKQAKVGNSSNQSNTKLIAITATVVFMVGGLGGGGYWYYQKVETEKAIALQRQQVEEQRLKAEAQAKADEAQRLAVQNARLEAEMRASEERQRLQAQMQQQQREAEQRQQQLQAQLQQQQQREAEQRQQQMQAQRANQQSGEAQVRLENKNCVPQYIFVDSKLVAYLGKGLSKSVRTSIGRHTVKSCSDMTANNCGNTGNPYWQSANESHTISCN
jgi:DNA repair exonuclease SbcCD ATPase subunit